MPDRRTLIYGDDCVACSALAQVIGARAPDIRRISVYSPEAQILLRRHFPGGWTVRPYLILSDAKGERILSGAALVWQVARLLGPSGIVTALQALSRKSRRKRARGDWAAAPAEQMRAYVPGSPAEAATFAGEPLLLPGVRAGLAFERVIQWYNLKGAVQTASYWTLGDAGIVLEQGHRPSPAPQMEGGRAEPAALGDGRDAVCHRGTDAEDGPLTLVIPLPHTRWLILRSKGLARETAIAVARSCLPIT